MFPLKFHPNPTTNYTFKMHLRTCTIILHNSLFPTVLSFRVSSSHFGKFQPQCSYKIVLIKKKECKIIEPQLDIPGSYKTKRVYVHVHVCVYVCVCTLVHYKRLCAIQNQGCMWAKKKTGLLMRHYSTLERPSRKKTKVEKGGEGRKLTIKYLFQAKHYVNIQ